MNTPESFKTNPRRDATDSIRGYVYQIYQSILAWMSLKENELLVLEGAEDFDVHNGNNVSTTQVKDVASNLTLRSQAVVDTLNNFWACREENQEFIITLRFLTTAEAGQEQGTPFGSNQKGIEFWEKAQTTRVDIQPLRSFLESLSLNEGLLSFIQTASNEDLLEKLIRPIKWDMGNKSSEALQYAIEDKLKVHGFKLQINSQDSSKALPDLLKKTADLLSTKGQKKLRFSDFLSCFDNATRISIPLGKVEAMTGAGALQQLANLVDLSELSRLTNTSTPISPPLPIVNGCVSRASVVTRFVDLLLLERVVFLYGSSGTGKTTLASLVSQNIESVWGWASFRGLQPEQTKDIIGRANFEMNSKGLSPFLVLDDIDLSEIGIFERELVSLIFSAMSANGLIIITGLTRPPLQLLPKLWKNESCEASVPYFDQTEIAEIVCAHGLSDAKIAQDWAKTIWIATSGHPQLVHARVRNLSSQGWPSIQLSDLTNPEDVERVRAEARTRLLREFPTEDIRVLAYRLSLVNGSFTREIARAVSETPPPIKLPGEAFDALIGPWIEREGENRFRISPLLKGAADYVLSEEDTKGIHGVIALSFIKRNSIEGNSIDYVEFSTAFFHAFMARDSFALMMLSQKILASNIDNVRHLYDMMLWMTFVCSEDGQKIFPENPTVELILRLVQFKLLVASPDPNKSISLIKHLEGCLNSEEPSERKLSSEAMVYGIVLNTLEVNLPSGLVIKMLSRMIDIIEESSFLGNLADSFSSADHDLPQFGENKPAQVLFSYQAVRIQGLDDLSELIKALEGLPPTKRDQLLAICDSDFDFPTLLVNRAWLKDVEDGTLDVAKAIQVFESTAKKTREWKVEELTKACLVAMSVVQDEYGHSADRALKILDEADHEFPEEASLVNQRAKVLFRAGRVEEALSFAHKALALPALSNVSYIFCCRDAGIAAANAENWPEAERMFLHGSERAKRSDGQVSMGVGLMGDSAFAMWKQKKFGKSLLLFADVLDALNAIPHSNDIRNHHLHATVRHCVTWVQFDARTEKRAHVAEPVPGMCSNQEPHEKITDHQIVEISTIWALLALTENTLDLDLGIGPRSQVSAGENKPVLLEAYERALAFDSMFKKRNFEDFVALLIAMHEAMHYSKINEEGGIGWDIKVIPRLPDGYWETSENKDAVCLYLLSASVISSTGQGLNNLPIAQWRTDFEKTVIHLSEVNQLLNVLEGTPPDESLYQQAAASIYALNGGTVDPEELWTISFRLLNTFMHQKSWVEDAMEGLLVARWLFAVESQRFAFIAPAVSCPGIKNYCLSETSKGLPKVASILMVSAPCLDVRPSKGVMEMLKSIISRG